MTPFERQIRDIGDAVYRRCGPSLQHYCDFVVRTSRPFAEPPDYVARALKSHPAILLFWHGQTMLTPSLIPWHQLPARALVADNTAAQPLAEALAQKGLGLIRGRGANRHGQDRGGARALRAAVTSLKEGFTVTMTANGPLPAPRSCGRGAIMIAKLSGRPIIPFAVASSKHATFKSRSWTFNLPFSRLGIVMAEPIHVPADAGDTLQEALRQQVEQTLNAITARAYALAGADVADATPDIAPTALNDPMQAILIPKHNFTSASQTAERDQLMFQQPDAMDQLGRSLAFGDDPIQLGRLRVELLSGAKTWAALLNTAWPSGLTAALATRLEQKGLLPPTPRQVAQGTASPTSLIRNYVRAHLTLRAAARSQLAQAATALNAEGVVPVVHNGGSSLWNEATAWRHLDRLDLLVEAERIGPARAALLALGYRDAAPWRAHETRLSTFRMLHSSHPAWIAISCKSETALAERVLPAFEILGNSQVVQVDGARVRVPSAANELLTGLVNHHFCTSTPASGVIDRRGLYEFAASFNSLGDDELRQLNELARRDVQLLAAADYWIAAAADWLSMPVRQPWSVQSDAASRWRSAKGRLANASSISRYRHAAEDLRMAWSRQRVWRATQHPSALSMQMTRLRLIGLLLPGRSF